jgi:DnaJ-domain-containing protein 1
LTQQLRFSTGQYIKIACKQLKALADNQSLEEMLIFLFAIAASDTFIVEKERKLLYQICLYLGFNDTLFYKIMSLYKDVSSPYAILEVSETVTKEELTLAYRKKVLLYHPDSSQLHLSEAEKTRKFLAVKSAFDAIMKEKFQKL